MNYTTNWSTVRTHKVIRRRLQFNTNLMYYVLDIDSYLLNVSRICLKLSLKFYIFLLAVICMHIHHAVSTTISIKNVFGTVLSVENM